MNSRQNDKQPQQPLTRRGKKLHNTLCANYDQHTEILMQIICCRFLALSELSLILAL